MKAYDAIPLPTRPGTSWKAANLGGSRLRCANCGEDYNRHGSPEGTAKALGLDVSDHLVCMASKEAWEEFHRLRRSAAAADFTTTVMDDAANLDLNFEERMALVGCLLKHMKCSCGGELQRTIMERASDHKDVPVLACTSCEAIEEVPGW